MRIRGLFVLSALAVLSAGCSSIEPWVKPYDRENLADPIMAFSRAPISQDFLDRAAPPAAAVADAAVTKGPHESHG
jgi:hypothetical protein